MTHLAAACTLLLRPLLVAGKAAVGILARVWLVRAATLAFRSLVLRETHVRIIVMDGEKALVVLEVKGRSGSLVANALATDKQAITMRLGKASYSVNVVTVKAK